MQPAAALVGLTPPPPIAIRGRWFRFLACSPIPGGGGSGFQPTIVAPGKVTPCYIRRGRFPLRVQINNQQITIMGSDWHEIQERRDSTEITLLGNDESDAAIGWLQSSFAVTASAAPTVHAPGSAYQYVIESCDDPPYSVDPARPDERATGTNTQEVTCPSGAGEYFLLDRGLPRCFDRSSVFIQNQGPYPIKVVALGDWDLFAAPGYTPTLGSLGQILDAAPAPGQAGGSWLVEPAGWGLSFWGQAMTADQVAGAATVVTES
jgi:hypothetical protein